MAKEVNISSYSGDVVSGDWQPAFASALAAIPDGGTVNIDADVTIKSQGNYTAISNIRNILFQGNGGNTITADAGVNDACFNFGALASFVAERVPFLGKQTTAGGTDCKWLFYVNSVERLIINRCVFAGVAPASSIIRAGSGMGMVVVKNSKFGGCGGTDEGVIATTDGANLTIEDTDFIDFQNWLGLFYDRQAGKPAWIKCVNPSGPFAGASCGNININRVRFDEQCPALIADNYQIVRVNGAMVNSNNFGPSFQFTDVELAKIQNTNVGYSASDMAAAQFTTCGDIEINRMRVDTGISRVLADASTRIKIRNSPLVELERV